MKAHHLSGSKVDLAFCCQYWARGDVEHTVRPTGAPAKLGNVVHKASDCWHKGEPLPNMEREEALIWGSLRGWLEAGERFTHSELPILYDATTDTATICKTGTDDRDYLGVTANKIPMRLDLVDADDGVIVDIKTGSKSNTEPAPTNLQLATQAVAASRLLGITEVRVGLVFPMKTKVHKPEWHTLDADALDEHAGKLHRVLKMIPNAEPNRGSWCWRCPIGPANGFTSSCPAWAGEEAA